MILHVHIGLYIIFFKVGYSVIKHDAEETEFLSYVLPSPLLCLNFLFLSYYQLVSNQGHYGRGALSQIM